MRTLTIKEIEKKKQERLTQALKDSGVCNG